MHFETRRILKLATRLLVAGFGVGVALLLFSSVAFGHSYHASSARTSAVARTSVSYGHNSYNRVSYSHNSYGHMSRDRDDRFNFRDRDDRFNFRCFDCNRSHNIYNTFRFQSHQCHNNHNSYSNSYGNSYSSMMSYSNSY